MKKFSQSWSASIATMSLPNRWSRLPAAGSGGVRFGGDLLVQIDGEILAFGERGDVDHMHERLHVGVEVTPAATGGSGCAPTFGR